MAGVHEYHESVLGLHLADLRYLDADLAYATLEDDRVYEMAFGDAVMQVEEVSQRTRFTIVGGRFHGRRASVKGRLPLRPDPILRLSMIDVQQGDGLILETPAGQLLFIDGGDNQLFARHVAARFAGTTAEKPLEVDAMIVTHGDADHFVGLSEIAASEGLRNSAAEPDRERKRVFLHPARVLHNGIVKRATKWPDGRRRKETEMLGPSATIDGRLHLTGLVESPLDVARSDMNRPFQGWAETLDHWDRRRLALGRSPMQIARVDHERGAAFGFLDRQASLDVEVIGPMTQDSPHGKVLPFLRQQAQGPAASGTSAGSHSASHTINGHSIALRLRCGRVRFMFTGDLNQESMDALRRARPGLDLQSEILKVPHHGSADFDLDFVRDVSPVVSIISSGDESSAKEYIHPRANLLAALGRASRGDTGILFVTELAAFFAVRGQARELRPASPARAAEFFAFERTNFGIVHVRTDGQRVLAFTHSGKRGMNEAYGFTVDAGGCVEMTAQLAICRG